MFQIPFFFSWPRLAYKSTSYFEKRASEDLLSFPWRSDKPYGREGASCKGARTSPLSCNFMYVNGRESDWLSVRKITRDNVRTPCVHGKS